jgi:hypothetical protein
VIVHAAAALPHDDRDRATATLREQLRVVVTAVCATPDWTTLTVTGPECVPGSDDNARFEWTASVAVD